MYECRSGKRFTEAGNLAIVSALSEVMFLKGITIGFSIAAPVGPIGLLCIRRSLTAGILPGLMTGLGAATADAVYGCIAGFGMTALSSFLVRQQLWLGLLGGFFLCYLAFRIIKSKPPTQSVEPCQAGLLSAFGSTFLLTVANPLTILSFAAVFAGFGVGVGPNTDYRTAWRLVAGVFTGSALWWLLLSGGVSFVRARLGHAVLRSINWVSGGVILAFGVYSVGRALLG
jgi:threonine/homoserine/homoserine lactone efflux protein